MKIPTFLFLVLSFFQTLFSLNSIQVLQWMETDDCWISVIENSEGKKSILKQIKDEVPDEQFLLVIDAVACTIAEKQKIPMNKITLIPAGELYPGKKYLDRLASLHTLAPGIATSESFPWPGFDLHQRLRKKDSISWQKWGPLSLEDTGLTPTVIHQMSLHPVLPLIAALDTFTGNADRSHPNIFFDPDTNSFCGIDMAAAFNSLLPEAACFQMDRILKGEIVLSKDEIIALGRYRLTFNSLIENFPSEKICDLLDHTAKQAGFYPGSPLFTEDVQNRIRHHKKIIRENYQSSCELLYRMNCNAFLDILDNCF